MQADGEQAKKCLHKSEAGSIKSKMKRYVGVYIYSINMNKS